MNVSPIIGDLECAKANFAMFQSDDPRYREAIGQLDDAIFRLRAWREHERLKAVTDATCGHVTIKESGQ